MPATYLQSTTRIASIHAHTADLFCSVPSVRINCISGKHKLRCEAHSIVNKCVAWTQPWGRSSSSSLSWTASRTVTWRAWSVSLETCSSTISLKITNSTITDWNSREGGCLKVVGLGGARAVGILQFCQESGLLPSAELWNFVGDGADLESFELLFKNSDEDANANPSWKSSTKPVHATPSFAFIVIAIGASLCSKPAIEILQSCKAHGGLCVMLVIQPFNFEGIKRKKEMEELAGSLQEHVDLTFVFEHDALFRRERVTLAEALNLADRTTLHVIKALADLFLGQQEKYYDSPPDGFGEITNLEIGSIFERAGKAWIGSGSSYSVKSAVQRAAFESPFLQRLIPGLKGLVTCTLSCSDSKGKRDIQAAVHTLRCLIGPRARILCTSVKEPTLGQGVIFATIIVVRMESTNRNGSTDTSTQLEDGSALSLSSAIVDYSSSMNGRELRKPQHCISVDGSSQLTDKPIAGEPAEEAKPPSSSPRLVDYDLDLLSEHSILGCGDPGDPMQDISQLQNLENVVCLDVRESDNNPSELSHLNERELSTGELPACSPTTQEGVTREGNYERPLFTTTSDEVYQGLKQDDADPWGLDSRWPYPDEKDEDAKWKLPSLSSIFEWGKSSVGPQMKSFMRWESGPNSAVAEAWATTRRRLENFGVPDKSELLPFGVKSDDPPGAGTSSTLRKGASKTREGESSTTFDLSTPLSKAFSNGIGAVVDIYSIAAMMILKSDEDEEQKQASSFLSERAASMLETERSRIKLTPLVEMKYKNGIYKGRCFGGLPEGKGRLTYRDGSFYDGLWKQGKRAGAGSFYYANGDVFQGYWRDDQMHGKGWFYYHMGDRLYADFWKGKANGEGRYYTARGDVFFGHFRDNWRHGKSLFIEATGIRWSEMWDHGVLLSRTRLQDKEEMPK